MLSDEVNKEDVYDEAIVEPGRRGKSSSGAEKAET